MKIREPSVAGQFYPANPTELQKEIEKMLGEVTKKEDKKKICGIITPHAGYQFSGKVAATCFKQIEGEEYERIILLGPSHQMRFNGTAIYPGEYFRTPLGDIPLDTEFIEKLVEKQKLITENETPHRGEHSLEVVLPFLQVTVKEFKLIPIAIGEDSFSTAKMLASSIVDVIEELKINPPLIVASSDFYHGYNYNECVRSVDRSVDLITHFNIEEFHKSVVEENSACGGGGIVTLMLIMKEIGATGIKIIEKTNSGEVTGIKEDYVVGYVGFVFEKKGILGWKEKKLLIQLVYETIKNHLKGKETEITIEGHPILREKRGCFVTLKKDRKLRGCIGYIFPVKPLYQAVKEMAIESAFGDPRFPPIREEEISEIKVEISILSQLEEVKNIEEIQIGTHGLYIKKDNYSGLLLPQVAVEEGWNVIQFLENTAWKAGLGKDEWRNAEVYKFEAEVFGNED